PRKPNNSPGLTAKSRSFTAHREPKFLPRLTRVIIDLQCLVLTRARGSGLWGGDGRRPAPTGAGGAAPGSRRLRDVCCERFRRRVVQNGEQAIGFRVILLGPFAVAFGAGD